MTVLVAIAALVGWAASVVVLGQTGTVLAVPALAGWSVSAVLGVDASWRRERMPRLVVALTVAAAVLFVWVAVPTI